VAEITTKVDEPVRSVSACSVTNEAIAEIRRVDDSFHVSLPTLMLIVVSKLVIDLHADSPSSSFTFTVRNRVRSPLQPRLIAAVRHPIAIAI